jgi:hypothetical protein
MHCCCCWKPEYKGYTDDLSIDMNYKGKMQSAICISHLGKDTYLNSNKHYIYICCNKMFGFKKCGNIVEYHKLCFMSYPIHCVVTLICVCFEIGNVARRLLSYLNFY